MITLNANATINVKGFKLGKTPLNRGVLGDITNVVAKFDSRNIISIENAIIDRSDIDLPSWGIKSNVGNLSFVDMNKKFLSYAESGWLKEGLLVELFIKDTLSKKNSSIGKLYTGQWNYDNDNNTVSVSLKDDLEEWQDIDIEGIEINPKYPSSTTGIELYNYLYQQTPSKYKVVPLELLESEVYDKLANFKYKNNFLKKGSLWNGWDKLCKALGLYIYKNNSGDTELHYSLGS